MKVAKVPLIISAVITLVLLTACQNLGVPKDRDLARKYLEMQRPAVIVTNSALGATGSGVLISKHHDSYLVLTAQHVVEKEPLVLISFNPGGPFYPGVVLRTNESQDLALVRVRLKEERNVARLCLGEPEMFERVWAVGSGLVEPLFPTDGIISNVFYYFDDFPNIRYIQHSAPIAPGNSGGPLYKKENGHYCVTGINLRGRTGLSQFSYAAHLYEIYSFLRNPTTPNASKTN